MIVCLQNFMFLLYFVMFFVPCVFTVFEAPRKQIWRSAMSCSASTENLASHKPKQKEKKCRQSSVMRLANMKPDCWLMVPLKVCWRKVYVGSPAEAL